MKILLITDHDQQATKVCAASGYARHLRCIKSEWTSLQQCRMLFDCQGERMTAPGGSGHLARLPRPYRKDREPLGSVRIDAP